MEGLGSDFSAASLKTAVDQEQCIQKEKEDTIGAVVNSAVEWRGSSLCLCGVQYRHAGCQEFIGANRLPPMIEVSGTSEAIHECGGTMPT